MNTTRNMNATRKSPLTAVVLAGMLACGNGLIAQEAAMDDEKAKAAELAMKLQNPVANLINFPLQNNFDWGGGPNDDGFADGFLVGD